MKSLKAQGHLFASSDVQMEVLNKSDHEPFDSKLKDAGLYPFKPTGIDIFQVNLGKMCNQTCKHCHVDAGPDRKEIMTRKTMQQCLDILAVHDIPKVDLTGGAPEMNPNFRWFVEEAAALGKHIMDRCNLTIITANKKYNDLPQFFAKHGVEVISSLPHYTSVRTDRQRGDGVFDRSVKAIRMLNEIGYGIEGTGLELNLVYNPTGAILPGPQETLEADYKRELKRRFGIEFNNLYVITNMPISRFLDYLLVSNNYENYMQKLVEAFNPNAAGKVMCRNTLSIGWDGYIYDCDFNQMLDIKVKSTAQHLSDFDFEGLNSREIEVNQHCYGCTAGPGSSCGGQTS
ncbi:arsenosugar biosynthesis radical SAM (seleno)protein ArsS [Cyclobacterium roseum]|uniref:arsenosugar biosynthesis radical SAM (seleno)protein ArsS n=1 Tax=Cyclobacterium roseum TaxID=2666137 RepID=UPI0013908C4F|nr:arsenosugar biosynthesis radical SAM (seleno)protein ArsS [Cyclobacterium roseum]